MSKGLRIIVVQRWGRNQAVVAGSTVWIGDHGGAAATKAAAQIAYRIAHRL